MKYETLRQAVKNYPKYNGCVKVERSPLIHRGFPGTFNLSFNEKHWLDEFGRYTDFSHDYIFSTVQSCIRPDDILKLDTPDAWKYLGVFELADLTGMMAFTDRPDHNKLQRWQVRNLIDFLENLGISPDRVHASYCSGGKVADLTKGKYSFDFDVPEDEISRNAFIENGVPESNLIPDNSRDTFLSLHLHRPTPWGYRNEISVNIGTEEESKLVDIATIEYSQWAPLYKNSETTSKNIVDLRGCNNGFSIVATGLERLCMVANGLPRIQDVDYIIPFYEALGEERVLGGESLRALHRIYSDITHYGCRTSRHHKKKMRYMLQKVDLILTGEQVRELLKIHSETQPWHPELQEGIEPTIERIKLYNTSKK